MKFIETEFPKAYVNIEEIDYFNINSVTYDKDDIANSWLIVIHLKDTTFSYKSYSTEEEAQKELAELINCINGTPIELKDEPIKIPYKFEVGDQVIVKGDWRGVVLERFDRCIDSITPKYVVRDIKDADRTVILSEKCLTLFIKNKNLNVIGIQQSEKPEIINGLYDYTPCKEYPTKFKVGDCVRVKGYNNDDVYTVKRVNIVNGINIYDIRYGCDDTPFAISESELIEADI